MRKTKEAELLENSTVTNSLRAFQSYRCKLCDEDIDNLIGLERGPIESSLDFTQLIMDYGHHRVDTGDFPYAIIRSAFEVLQQYQWSSILDIGSGYGRLLHYAALVFDCRAYGIELVHARARESMRVAGLRRLEKVNIRAGDATQVQWPKADVYFVMNSVLPSYMPQLTARIERIALRRNIFVVSHSSANRFFADSKALMVCSKPDYDTVGLWVFRSAR